ncbi:hypothetical protein [Formosa sp. A9]|uniref:hypothetical protein n=1 Tax=Formosa sp. A9 TaxID=3442641 RepID=UPI003EC09249
MHKFWFTILFLFSVMLCNAQIIVTEIEKAEDSIKTKSKEDKKTDLLKHIGNGYLPIKYFNLDLRYLFKFNQFEGIRTGLGGSTSNLFSKKFKLNAYTVYGFKDGQYKYSFGGGLRLNAKHQTWVNATYTDDLQETASTHFLTDKRIFQFFEPRLLNISLFYRHITKSVTLEHDFIPQLTSAFSFSVSNIDPKFNYIFLANDTAYNYYELTTAQIALLWNPFDVYKPQDNGFKKTKNGYPKFTLQYTQSIADAFQGDFNFYKLDFKGTYHWIHNKESHSEIDFASGIAIGDAPLTHLFHAYPNNINKATIMQRFSVAGLNSFETMYFNEFFSDVFTALQFKHYFKPFYHSTYSKPQLVLISRFALGDMQNPSRHQGITFKTLDKGYLESGFELNQLVFGFGLSLTYRYGAYHLQDIEDNIALKFTFNVTL